MNSVIYGRSPSPFTSCDTIPIISACNLPFCLIPYRQLLLCKTSFWLMMITSVFKICKLSPQGGKRVYEKGIIKISRLSSLDFLQFRLEYQEKKESIHCIHSDSDSNLDEGRISLYSSFFFWEPLNPIGFSCRIKCVIMMSWVAWSLGAWLTTTEFLK